MTQETQETGIKEEVKVEESKDKLQIEIEQYVNTLKMLQADFENYIKRTEKEKQELTRYATHKFITKLLKIVDDYEKAVEHIKKKDEELSKGLVMIHKQLHRLLEDEGVIPIPTEKTKFDPYKHEVIDVIEGEGEEEGKIVDEIQKGYMMNDKVLRTSKVRISKKKEK